MGRVETNAESAQRFDHNPGFSQQYTNVYYCRLQQLKDEIKPPQTWTATAKRRDRILDIEAGEVSWVIGTIVRELTHKPNIFEDLKSVYHGTKPQHDLKYCSPEDKIFLEDEHGRIAIIGALRTRELLVTGSIVALLGAQNQIGEFDALEICYPSLPAVPKRNKGEKSSKIALISGMNLDERDSDTTPFLQMAHDYISQDPSISRLIICGNSMTAAKENLVGSRVMRPQASVESLKAFDEHLASFAQILPTHVMPGESDPASIAFPQNRIHPALLKRSREFLKASAIVLETNPQQFSFEDTIFLGTSGQPVNDVLKYTADTPYTNKNLELDILHKTMHWRHISPTAPDTLWSYPFVDEDPLVLHELPHVYFSGNATRFATDVRDGVRLVCVPSFDKTRELILINMNTLEPEVVKFG